MKRFFIRTFPFSEISILITNQVKIFIQIDITLICVDRKQFQEKLDILRTLMHFVTYK